LEKRREEREGNERKKIGAEGGRRRTTGEKKA